MQQFDTMNFNPKTFLYFFKKMSPIFIFTELEVWSAMCKDYCVIFNTWWRGILWLHNEYFMILCHYSTVRKWIRLNHFSRISNSGSTKRHKHFSMKLSTFTWNEPIYFGETNNSTTGKIMLGALCILVTWHSRAPFFPMIKFADSFMEKIPPELMTMQIWRIYLIISDFLKIFAEFGWFHGKKNKRKTCKISWC